MSGGPGGYATEQKKVRRGDSRDRGGHRGGSPSNSGPANQQRAHSSSFNGGHYPAGNHPLPLETTSETPGNQVDPAIGTFRSRNVTFTTPDDLRRQLANALLENPSRSGNASPGGSRPASRGSPGGSRPASRGSPGGSGPASRESSGSRSPWTRSGRSSPALEGYDGFHSDLVSALNQRLREQRPREKWDVSSGRLGPIGRRPTWTNTANSTPDMLAGRRIAQQMLERPGEQVPLVNGWEWGSLLVEVQVLLAPDQGIIFVSSNSSKGNAALERAFPDVHRFRRTVRDALQRRIDARFPEGVVPPRGSSAINNDTIARRAVKVLRLLSQSDWSLLIVPNGENRHAEQAIESYQQKQYPTIARTGPATGTRPPCLGCIIHMARPDVDALKYYEAVEAPIQVGDYYTKATSGARS